MDELTSQFYLATIGHGIIFSYYFHDEVVHHYRALLHTNITQNNQDRRILWQYKVCLS